MNSKIYYGNTQPNSKEFKIWVNDEGVIKTWDGNKWNAIESNSGSTSTPSLGNLAVAAVKGWYDFVFQEGMTWEIFLGSIANIWHWTSEDGYVYVDYLDNGWLGHTEQIVLEDGYTGVKISDTIKPNYEYKTVVDDWGVGGGV